MIYLLLCIVFTTAIFLIFKKFEEYKIDSFQAIVVNYIIAACLGFSFNNSGIALESIPHQSWFFNAVIIGILFISMFNVVAITSQKIGISIASIASKMSLIIPVVFAVYLYGDSMSFVKIAGVVLALLSVYLTFYPSGNGKQTNKKLLIFPIILFVGTGLLDTLFKYTEHKYLTGNDLNLFLSSLFTVAAFAGFIVVIIMITAMRNPLHIKSIIGGVVLGIPNYGSIYFLMRTLEIENFESSVIFPVNNIGIIGLSAIAAFFLFKEKMTMINWTGIVLSIIAIAMIAL